MHLKYLIPLACLVAVTGCRSTQFFEYYPDSKLVFEKGSHRNGLRDGTWKVYSEEGEVLYETKWVKGAGFRYEVSPRTNLIKRFVCYIDGVPSGIGLTFDSNGPRGWIKFGLGGAASEESGLFNGSLSKKLCLEFIDTVKRVEQKTGDRPSHDIMAHVLSSSHFGELIKTEHVISFSDYILEALYENGKLRGLGEKSKSLPEKNDGLSSYYLPDGNLWLETNYSKGVRNGSYYTNRLGHHVEGQYVQGKETGVWLVRDDEWALVCKTYWNRGTGFSFEYGESRPHSYAQFIEGRKVGLELLHKMNVLVWVFHSIEGKSIQGKGEIPADLALKNQKLFSKIAHNIDAKPEIIKGDWLKTFQGFDLLPLLESFNEITPEE